MQILTVDQFMVAARMALIVTRYAGRYSQKKEARHFVKSYWYLNISDSIYVDFREMLLNLHQRSVIYNVPSYEYGTVGCGLGAKCGQVLQHHKYLTDKPDNES